MNGIYIKLMFMFFSRYIVLYFLDFLFMFAICGSLINRFVKNHRLANFKQISSVFSSKFDYSKYNVDFEAVGKLPIKTARKLVRELDDYLNYHDDLY